MTKTKVVRVLTKVGHAAALMFGAFWLVATTNVVPAPPPRDCFSDVPSPSSLRVELGAPETSSDGGASSETPSCGGIDGLAAGAAITLAVTQGPKPEDGGGCYGFTTQAIDGLLDVTLSSAPVAEPTRDSLTVVDGSFKPSQSQVCGGPWYFLLAPETAPPDGQLISPLEAGATQRWYVYRSIGIAAANWCEPIGQSPLKDGLQCEDRFPVVSITRTGP